ncbi:glycosyltransferase family 39 protein [Candidatus Gottesmanbacteria bacterium]|nr:glycosyltransferase family 39 protein [Candidatus Gottesmanbacteria bacterium]
MKHKQVFLLVLIIFLAAFLRLFRVNEIPPGVNRDEASIGFTAYSLMQTGNDEYGKPFPLSFQSFGDWKLPLYIYTTIPFVKLFGLNELAVRLPSVIAGTLTVFLTYFLVKELCKAYNRYIALLSALLLAISPWHIHLSRVESESNVAVFLTVSALLLFLKGLKNTPVLLGLSFPIFALTYYTYHGNHVFTTLLLISLCAIYHKDIPRKLPVFVGAILSVVLIVFILSQTLLGADKTKISGISIFGSPNVIHENIELPRNRSANPNEIMTRLRYNRVTYAVITITKNYINSFSPNFLFVKGGGNAAHNIKNFGNLYLVELPFFYAGIILLLYSLFFRHSSLLIWWLLISPIAGMITKDAPHTNRMFAIFPLPPIITALGIMWVISVCNKRTALQYFAVIVILLAYSVNIAYYMNRYYNHFAIEEQANWGIGYKQLTDALFSDAYRSKKVIMARPEYSPYIFVLFYSGFNPLRYQTTAVRYPPTSDDFVHVAAFDRFSFREINWSSDPAGKNTVLVAETVSVPTDLRASPYTHRINAQWTLVSP